MRIGRVIGKVTLNNRLAELPHGTFLLVAPMTRGMLAGSADNEGGQHMVAYDTLGAREGDRVGLLEGREAANPFHPTKVPFDAYCAAIMDTIDFDPILPVE